MEVFGFIVLIVFAFIFFGLAGWVLKGLGVIFEFFWAGCSTSFGCLFWVFVLFLIIIGLAL